MINPGSRTVGEILETRNTLDELSGKADAEAYEVLTPEEIKEIETLEFLTGRMIVDLTQRQLSLAQLATSPEIVVPRGDTNIAPDNTVGNTESDTDYFETPEFWNRFRYNQEQSDSDFKEKQRIIAIFNGNISDIIRSSKNTKNGFVKPSTKKMVTGMVRLLGVDKIYTNSGYMQTLFDLIFNIENTDIRDLILSEIRVSIKNQFVERDGSINQEYLPAAMSILALAADNLDAQGSTPDEKDESLDISRELFKFAEELIDATFVHASQAKPDFTLKHYAEFFIAVASMPDTLRQRQVLERFQKYFTQAGDYVLKIYMVLALGIKSDTNPYAIEVIANESMKLNGFNNDNASVSSAVSSMLPREFSQIGSNITAQQQRYAYMILEYAKTQGLKGDHMQQFESARNEFIEGYERIHSNFEEAILQLIPPDIEGDIDYSSIDEQLNEIYYIPLKELANSMSEKYPQYKSWFEGYINTEDSPYLIRYRSLVPGRTSIGSVASLLSGIKESLIDTAAEGIFDEIDKLPEFYREGLYISCPSIVDESEALNEINQLPIEEIYKIKERIKSRGRNTAPKAFLELNGVTYYFRVATEQDTRETSELDLMADLSGKFVPDIVEKSEDEVMLAIKNKQISTRTNANRYVSERGFQVKVKVADKTCEITMKRKANESYIAGVLSIEGYAKVPFIFDNNMVLHLPSSQNSSFANEMALFLTNVFYQYSCSEVLSPEDSSDTDIRKQFYQIVPHLTYLPVNKKYTTEARDLFLKEQGQDLESVSRARSIIDPEHRNTTYNRGAERDATSAGPVRISIKRELLSELE